MNRTWKIAIVHDTSRPGLGGHDTHLAFRGLPGVEVVGLADSNPKHLDERLAAVRAERHYNDFVEMFDREKPDIALLASRLPAEHFAPIKAAAERGIHVLCEKPMTNDLEEADEIIRLAERYNVKIAVALLARYAPVFRTMKQMIAAGAIGTPLTFYGRGKEDDRGGGEDMVVLGTHILDIGCFLFGNPESVFAEVTVGGRPLRRSDRSATREPLGAVAGDNVFALLRFPGGVRGVFESRRGLFRQQVRMGVTVAGSGGTLSVRYDNDRKLRLSRSPFPPEDEAAFEEVPLIEPQAIPGADPIDFGYLEYFTENNRLAAWDLMAAIEDDRPPLANACNARTVLEIINGVYASQLSGRVISLPLRDRRHPLEIPD